MQLFTHSFTPSVTHSSHSAHTSPSGTERESAFPFLTPITHEVLIPYDGCQSPAVYISSSLLQPLIFLSALPCDYSYYFFILFFLRAKRKRVIVFLDEWMVGQMDERMDGHNLIDRQHDITAPPKSQGSVLALTVRDVKGKPMEEEKQEVMCNSLYSYSVKTQTTTEGKQIPSALYNIIKLVWVIFVSHRLYWWTKTTWTKFGLCSNEGTVTMRPVHDWEVMCLCVWDAAAGSNLVVSGC